MRGHALISKRRVTLLLVALSVAVTVKAGSPPVGVLETINQEVTSIYEKSCDAIVRVHAERDPGFDRFPFGSNHRIGTGFFIDSSGRLLTAATVVDDRDRCWIDWRGQRLTARIVGRDPHTNLALLQTDLEQATEANRRTPALPLGNSDELQVGSMVIAIGFPYDLPSAPVVGFVGGFDVKCGGHVFALPHIRASCKLSPGQAGSPLLNARGEVVGLAVAAHQGDHCYALPIHGAQKVVADIMQYGEPRHGWVGLGVAERQVGPPSAGSNRWQVFVQEVFSNTPAAEAGFHEGDVLVRIHTNDVHRLTDVLNSVFYYHRGETATVTVVRDGQPRTDVRGQSNRVSIVIGQRPNQAPVQSAWRMVPITPSNQTPMMIPAAAGGR
jgi:S1-C subfamily serine protease